MKKRIYAGLCALVCLSAVPRCESVPGEDVPETKTVTAEYQCH